MQVRRKSGCIVFMCSSVSDACCDCRRRPEGREASFCCSRATSSQHPNHGAAPDQLQPPVKQTQTPSEGFCVFRMNSSVVSLLQPTVYQCTAVILISQVGWSSFCTSAILAFIGMFWYIPQKWPKSGFPLCVCAALYEVLQFPNGKYLIIYI